MFPKFGYIVGMDHVCRKRGPFLSEKAPLMELFFGTIAVENQHSCEIHRLVGYLSRDKP